MLAAASKYFSVSLGPNFQEGGINEFVLEGTDGETVKAIVDYCYTGQIVLTEENTGKLLAIASSVELDFLESECRQFYADNLSVTNCVDAFMVSDKYCYADIRRKAFDLICDSFEILPSAEIQNLDHRLLEEVLKSDEINGPEGLVFVRLMEWFQNNEEERERYMSQLLELIRLQHITTREVRIATAFKYSLPIRCLLKRNITLNLQLISDPFKVVHRNFHSY